MIVDRISFLAEKNPVPNSIFLLHIYSCKQLVSYLWYQRSLVKFTEKERP